MHNPGRVDFTKPNDDMAAIPLPLLITMPVGTPVPQAKGTIIWVGNLKNGTKKNGTPFRVQHVEISEGEAKVDVTIWHDQDKATGQWNRQTYSEAQKGQTLWVISKERKDKKGVCGVKLGEDSYVDGQGNQKVKFTLIVNENGEVVLGTDPTAVAAPPATPPTSAPATPPAVAPPQTQRPVPAPANGRKMDSIDAVIDAKKYLARCGNALVMAAEENVSTIRDFLTRQGIAWTPEMQQNYASAVADKMTETMFSTLFISLDRSGIVGRMPCGDLAKAIEQAKKRQEERGAEEMAKEEAAKAAKRAKAEEAARVAKQAADAAAKAAEEADDDDVPD